MFSFGITILTIGRAQESKTSDKNDIKRVLDKRIQKTYQHDAKMDPKGNPKSILNSPKWAKGSRRGAKKVTMMIYIYICI